MLFMFPAAYSRFRMIRTFWLFTMHRLYYEIFVPLNHYCHYSSREHMLKNVYRDLGVWNVGWQDESVGRCSG